MSGAEFDLVARLGAAPAVPDAEICSRARCEEPAATRLEWRNPRIHTPDRIKIWLACAEHQEFLLGFLTNRDFPVRVHNVRDPVNEAPIQ